MSNEITDLTSPTAEITELVVEEVSLVNKAANKKTFLIVKSDDGVEAVTEEHHEELLDESQGLGQENSDQSGSGELGEGVGSGEGTTGEVGEVVKEDAQQLAADIEALVNPATAEKSAEATAEPSDTVESLRKDFEALRSEIQKSAGATDIAEQLTVELKKAQDQLVEAQAFNKECRDLLVRVNRALSQEHPATVSVAKSNTSITPPSNSRGDVLESNLVTGSPSGRLPLGQDLNRIFRKDKEESKK